MGRLIVWAAVSFVISANGIGLAATAEYNEDLVDTKLPNGIASVASAGTPEATRAGGYIFRFRDGTFQVSPYETRKEEPKSSEELRDTIRRAGTGDLCFSGTNKGTFVAWSERASGLGDGYLFDLSGRELPRPDITYSKSERSGRTGKPYQGYLEGIVPGHRYLVETTDQHYALIRVLETTAGVAVIQWVYQPDGTKVFQIPRGALVKLTSTSSTTAIGTTESAKPAVQLRAGGVIAGVDVTDDTSFSQAVEKHLTDRKKLVNLLVDLIQHSDGPSKALAIRTVGELRAPEAAQVLAEQIDWSDKWSTRLEVTIEVSQPCGPALVKIGIPGASAANDEIAKCKRDTPASLRRMKLLTLVVLRVYDETLARVVLADRVAAAKTAEEKGAFEAALSALPEIQGWR